MYSFKSYEKDETYSVEFSYSSIREDVGLIQEQIRRKISIYIFPQLAQTAVPYWDIQAQAPKIGKENCI